MAATHQQIKQRSVDSLQKLYAVIVALAIGISIQSLFLSRTDGNFVVSTELLKYLPNFLAFVVTIIPFYHGMNRHLDACYIEKDEVPPKGSLLFDFIVFFGESFILFAIATTIRNGISCFVFIGVLLIVDSLWAIVSHLIHYRGIAPSVIRWAVINAITLGISVLFVLTQIYSDSCKLWILCCLATIRAVADYKYCWEFYFPSK